MSFSFFLNCEKGEVFVSESSAVVRFVNEDLYDTAAFSVTKSVGPLRHRGEIYTCIFTSLNPFTTLHNICAGPDHRTRPIPLD